MLDTLGLDTSNYTTSAALCQGGQLRQKKLLLPVRPGELGLRQSDAVFHHVRQLPLVLGQLLEGKPHLQAVGVSVRPRDIDGSYMPCFTVGEGTARAVSLTQGISLYTFSHQAGHIAAALYSAGRMDLLGRRFVAFHVSGGTTEAVLVEPTPENPLAAQVVACSLDLKAGQAVDRVGVLLGLPFPCGRQLEALASRSSASFRVKPSVKGMDCSLSGIENQCQKMLGNGAPPEDIARYCMEALLAALDAMAAALRQKYGLPMLFAGGVMSNHMLRAALEERYNALFAEPEFSADNAAGVALLAACKGD